MGPLVTALIVAALAFFALTLFELLLHRAFNWKSQNYRYGVWLLTFLIGAYAYLTSLGR